MEFGRKSVLMILIRKVSNFDFENFEFRKLESDRFVALILTSLTAPQADSTFSFVVWLRIITIQHGVRISSPDCGGVLIKPDLILTAAKCLCGNVARIWVRQ